MRHVWLSRLVIGLLVGVGVFSGLQAEALDCSWRVSGTVNHTAPGSGSCPLSTWRIRVSARWSTGCPGNCPWNVVNWGETLTNGSGVFSVTSNVFPTGYFLGNECTRRRDIRIEAYDGWTWSQVAVVSNVNGSNPNSLINGSGLGAGPIAVFNLGSFTTTLPGQQPCGTQNTNTNTGNGDGNGTGNNGNHLPEVGNKLPDKPDKKKPPTQDMQMEEVPPCSVAGAPAMGNLPDLTFQSVTVMPRPNATDPHRLRAQIVVANNGTGNYRGTNPCMAEVKVTYVAATASNGFFEPREYFRTLSDPIGTGTTRSYNRDANLPGDLETPPFLPPWAWVTFEMDHENKVVESNEGNNLQTVCYDVINQVTFPEGQGPCVGNPSQAAEQQQVEKPPSKKRRKKSSSRSSSKRRRTRSNKQ